MHSNLWMTTRIAFLMAAGALAVAAAGERAVDPRSTSPVRKVRGIIISTHTDGREWGWDAIGPTLEDIAEVGAGWIATHPYAAVRGDGSLRFRDFDPEHPPAHLVLLSFGDIQRPLEGLGGSSIVASIQIYQQAVTG